MVADALEEHLVGHAVVQVLARVDLVADVHAGAVERVEDRAPTFRQLVERLFDQAGRARRPRVEIGPGQRAGERRVRRQAQIRRRLGRVQHLLHGPLLARRRIAAHLGRGEAVEAGVVGRVHGHELALQVGRQLGDLQPVLRQRALHFVAIGLALGGVLQVEQAGRPSSASGCPCSLGRRPSFAIESSVSNGAVSPANCGQENGGPLDGLHVLSPVEYPHRRTGGALPIRRR